MHQILLLLPSVLGSAVRGRHVRGGPVGLALNTDKQSKNDLSPVIKLPPRGSDPKDPMCLADTGLKCGNGENSCQDWVACSEETHTCTCHHWGCADSAGACRPIKNQWFPSDNRLMALGAAKPGKAHRFAMMNATKAPMLQDEWPAGQHPEAIWKFLLMNDNATFLIATRQGRHDGIFLALPAAPWQEDVMIAPVQVKPEDAQQASWRLVERPQSRQAFQHVSSGRFLCYDSKTDGLSTCASKHCEANSVDFEVWPKIVGIPMLTSEASKLPGSNFSKPHNASNASKTDPASLYPMNKSEPVNTKKPWYLEDKNNSQGSKVTSK